MSEQRKYEIPTSFNLPVWYDEEFILVTESFRMHVTRGSRRRLRVMESGNVRGREETSEVLDWIQETVMRIRCELGVEG
jgi:hypothetical protein